MAALLESQPGRRPLELPAGSPPEFKPLGYFLGPEGATGLQVVLAEATRRPSTPDVRNLWKRRHGGVAIPLLLVVTYPVGAESMAAICGPTGDPPTLVFDLDPGTVERVAAAALDEPNRHAAVRFLVGVIGELESELPGLRNEGLFASHHLRTGVPARHDWAEACKQGEGLLKQRGSELVEALGFTIQQRDTATFTLRAGEDDTATAVAIFLDETETYEGAADRFMGSSPVSLALAKADADRLPFVVITRGAQIRIYAADKRIVGVGRKGRTETFVEANLALLPTESAGYLPLLFGAEALLPDGTFEQILERSKNYASDLSKRLRERVYTDVVPSLATAIARRSARARTLTEADLRFLYEESLFVLFRLVFIAYAEDKGLLPYATNDEYRQHALKTRAQRLADRWNEDGQLLFENQATGLWSDAQQLFRAVDKGNSEWAVPAYDGGLFSSDPAVSPVGAAIAELELNNSEFGPPLASLLVDVGDEGTYGAIDFRSLSVREFGTIYEGLLESSLSIAQSGLALDRGGTYVPAKAGDDIVVATGEVYLHNQSGARKSSGAYFTKEFAVEHLLDHALEPALDEHIARLTALLEAGDEASAGEQFFDFRVADIAMGSGHFLVNVVDHIEARLTSFLTENPLPVVNSELATLRATALARLGDAAEGTEIEQAALVRRQVARRCIYGVDVNPIAVELARLALWIHTFVPGLPLSFLDRTLVCGNSLTGIGSLEEAVEAVEGHSSVDGVMSLARDQIERYLEQARGPLQRLGRLSDATPADIAEAREAQTDAFAAVASASLVFDLAVAARLGEIAPLLEVNDDVLHHHPDAERAKDLRDELQALHFPVSFPEVFLRQRPGFDCVVGNPPWDKIMFEAQQFWVTRFPGLNALRPADREDAIAQLRVNRPDEAVIEARERAQREKMQRYAESGYRHQGRGHYDFAKLFVERAVGLLSRDGTLGYVLPRQSLVLSGWSKLRQLLIGHSRLLCLQARNKGGWLFDDVDHRYMIVLMSRLPRSCPQPPQGDVVIWPAVKSADEMLHAGTESAITMTVGDVTSLSEALVLPWFEEQGSKSVFDAMRAGACLASGDGWIKGTHDARWDFRGSGPHRRYAATEQAPGSWRILMTRHVNAFEIEREAPYQQFIKDPIELVGLGGVVGEAGSPRLGRGHPTIVVRHPSRNDDARTIIAAALADEGEIHNKGYAHAIAADTDDDMAERKVLALLAYLNTCVCDWWARRFVDRHVTAPIVNGLRLPRWTPEDIEDAAEVATALLVRHGTHALPGGYELAAPHHLETASELELVAHINVLAARGFDLEVEEMAVVLRDFSEKGCPEALRFLILGELA